MIISLDLAILIPAVATSLLLLWLVYRRNPQSATHKLFALLTISMIGWSIVVYWSYHVTSALAVTWLVRAVMAFATPMSVLFFLLMHTYPNSRMLLSKKTVTIWTVLTILTMGVAMSPLLFSSIEYVPGAAPTTTPGLGMLLFIPVSIGSIPLGIYFLIRKYIKAVGVIRNQLQWILVGVILMYGLIISLNFVAVNLYASVIFIPFGPLFTLPFTLITAYTIVRYRLMDVRLALFRGLSLFFLLGSLALIYGLIVIFAVPQIADLIGVRGDIIAAAAALISIPLARYTQKFLTQITDRFLFQMPIDYQAQLVTISTDLSGTIRIQDVTNIVIKVMTELVRSERTVIFLHDSTEKTFRPRASNKDTNINHYIPADHVLLKHLEHDRTPITMDDLSRIIESDAEHTKSHRLEEIRGALKWLNAEITLPLFVNKKLTGVIVLGPKLTGEPYTNEDINFLNTLAPQAATALENARLYQESLEFGRKLKSEVERATHELSLANAQLRDLDKAKSEFLSIASHQLNTPLTPLRGYLSMLLEGDFGKIPPKQKTIIQQLEKSATQLIGLIKNYLDLSRIESGRLELSLEELDLVEMTIHIIKELSPNADKKKLALTYTKPDEKIPQVVGDQERLRQVILNIIDNAIKYTGEGSVAVSIGIEGENIYVAVTDSGRGLEATEITKLFTKFTRVGGKDKFRAEGTGLGLFVAKQIIEEHHGHINVTSPGKEQGSTFTIYLPVKSSSQSLKISQTENIGATAEKPS